MIIKLILCLQFFTTLNKNPGQTAGSGLWPVTRPDPAPNPGPNDPLTRRPGSISAVHLQKTRVNPGHGSLSSRVGSGLDENGRVSGQCHWPSSFSVTGHFTFWISLSLSGIYVYSQASRSNIVGIYCTCPQIFIIIIILKQNRKELCRQIVLRTSNCDIFVKLSWLDICKPTRLHHSFLL